MKQPPTFGRTRVTQAQLDDPDWMEANRDLIRSMNYAIDPPSPDD